MLPWQPCLVASRGLFGVTSHCSLASLRGFKSSAENLAQTTEGRETSGSTGDWTKHTIKQFSVRPTYLSSLQAAYRSELDREERRQLVTSLLAAHRLLAEDVEGYDAAQIQRTARQRITRMRELADELKQLMPRSNLAQCNSRSLAFGYYALLEQSSGSRDVDAQAFHEVASGRQNAWDHWKQHFESKYATVPGLEPVEAIYARPDPLEELSKLRHSSSDASSSGADSGDGGSAREGRGRVQSAAGTAPMTASNCVDLHGTAHSIGKRKTSFARVALTQGTGRITINGVPLDSYFGDVGARAHVLRPLMLARRLGQYDIEATTEGGGFSGQAQAVRHGIARALALQDPRLEHLLRALTRWDGRQVERKKTGKAKARKGYAWVKR